MKNELHNLFENIFYNFQSFRTNSYEQNFEYFLRSELRKTSLESGYVVLNPIEKEYSYIIPPFGRFGVDLVLNINDDLCILAEIKDRRIFNNLDDFYYFCGQSDVLSTWLLFKNKSCKNILKLLIVTGDIDVRILSASLYHGIFPISGLTCRYYPELVNKLIEISKQCFFFYGTGKFHKFTDYFQITDLYCYQWVNKILSRPKSGISYENDRLILDLRYLSGLLTFYEVKRNLICKMAQLRHVYTSFKLCDIVLNEIELVFQRNNKYNVFMNLLVDTIFSEEEKREIVKRIWN